MHKYLCFSAEICEISVEPLPSMSCTKMKPTCMFNRYTGLTIVVLIGLLERCFRNLKYQVDSYSVVTGDLSTNYSCSNSSFSHSCSLVCNMLWLVSASKVTFFLCTHIARNVCLLCHYPYWLFFILIFIFVTDWTGKRRQPLSFIKFLADI